MLIKLQEHLTLFRYEIQQFFFQQKPVMNTRPSQIKVVVFRFCADPGSDSLGGVHVLNNYF